MKNTLHFWVVGGDMRQMWLQRHLQDHGHTVTTFALDGGFCPVCAPTLDGCGLADCVVLPLPVVDSGGYLSAPFSDEKVAFSHLLDQLSPNQFVCGGRVGQITHALGLQRGITIHDYLAREELAIANAVPTAEGCLQLAMERLPITVHGARILVIGYGRVGRATAVRFGALGAKVTVAARRYDQLACSKSDGFDADRIGQLAGYLCSYDCVVNTVPAEILGESELTDIEPDCLIIDLASAPGGVDLNAATRLERTIVTAPALPGRVAPSSAGALIQHTIYHMLEEIGF